MVDSIIHKVYLTSKISSMQILKNGGKRGSKIFHSFLKRILLQCCYNGNKAPMNKYESLGARRREKLIEFTTFATSRGGLFARKIWMQQKK